MKNSGYYEIGLNARLLQKLKATALAGNVIMNRLHWHDHLEILCCVAGSFSLRIDRDVMRLNAGDFSVINGGVPHEIFDGIPDGLQIIFSVDASLLRLRPSEQFAFTSVGPAALPPDCEDARRFKISVAKIAYLMNPITTIAMTFQRALYGKTQYIFGGQVNHMLPNWSPATYSLAVGAVLVGSIVLFLLSLLVFGRLEGNFAEEL